MAAEARRLVTVELPKLRKTLSEPAAVKDKMPLALKCTGKRTKRTETMSEGIFKMLYRKEQQSRANKSR
jgi:hypothetical protein